MLIDLKKILLTYSAENIYVVIARFDDKTSDLKLVCLCYFSTPM